MVSSELARGAADQRHQPDQRLQPARAERGVIEPCGPVGRPGVRVAGRIGGSVERRQGRLVQLDMVGVPVAAELVVADDYLRPMPADRGDDPAGNFVERRLEEAVRVRVSGAPAIPLSR